ncbi:amino acid adenylation domain-containing protein [Erwinia toletana]|uniref:Amino acid adenylation domain-containing protein n=1 Tax=Winslowiella toletana TaxID=92490 RepID=A0ABS4PAJ3_9GAMM|nr:non-ribosomal peptide synthetase [Winslowiella toletana]MBP2169665.1 amino acid adenylation domain-containing protein [Winslowiella toletana]
MPVYPLTTVQQAVLIDQLLTPDTPCYNIGAIWRIKRDIDISLLQKSTNDILHQHDALRIRLQEDESGIIQSTRPRQKIIIDYRDFTQQRAANDQAMEYLRVSFIKPFPLYNQLLWRCHFVRVNATDSLWLISAHHLIADGTTLSLLGRLIIDRYKQLKSGACGDLPAATRYADFIASDKAYLHSPRYAADRDFWLSRFSGTPASALAGERAASLTQQAASLSRQIVHPLPHQRYQQMEAYAAESGGSVMHFMLALLTCWYARLWQAESLTIGVPVHNRCGAQHKQTLGMFSSMIPLKIEIDIHQPFGQLIQQVASELRLCYRHQRYPIAELNRQLRLSQQGRRQLYDITFSLECFPTDIELDNQPLKVSAMHHGYEQMPLTIYLRHYHPQDDPLLEFNFNQGWFNEEWAMRTAARVRHLLKSVLDAATDLPMAQLPLLLATEQRQLARWNHHTQPWTPAGGVHRLFEQQVLRTPQAIALGGCDQPLRYSELNQQANQLAWHLRAAGIGRDDRVALCAERSNQLVIALLAILKAGAAYVPLDPDYPQERLSTMLQDSGARLLLLDDAGERATASAVAPGLVALHLQRDSARWQFAAAENLPASGVDPQRSLAYVIYTSGSTGQPKGVMNEHRGVINRLQWMQQAYQLTPEDRVLQKTPFSFDVSVWEFFWPLISGARLVMAKPGGHRDPDYLCTLIQQQQITTIHFVPSMLQLFLSHGDMAQCDSLQRIICSGEALPLATVQRCHRQLAGAALYNLYGPTEAAVDVSHWHCHPQDPRPLVPIGRPVSNTQLHILDAQLQPLPPGSKGELYIGGVQVARGYLNRPQLTAECFIRDPFSDDPAARLYKTGDLARWLEDGSIEYLGRNDFQVKIRGVRIETAEVEQQIRQCEGIDDAVVMARDDEQGDKRLVAWFVASDQPDLGPRLHRYLRGVLPDYMIPSALVQLQAWPLSPNGKLDRRALPLPTASRNDQCLAPESEDEQLLASWWQEILQVEKVSRDDDFFALGGHSIHAIQLMVRLRRQGLWLDIKTLYAHSSLSSQARAIRNLADDQQLAPEAINNPIQKLLAQLNQSPASFCLLQPLNSQCSPEEVWMIHPAVVGSEIYRDLALSLNGKLSAIGINNYNLFHQPHIDSLSDLAACYLRAMMAHGLSAQRTVRLLGWSLGGNIALEIAAQLEQQGFQDIHICVLDSVYQTEFQLRAEPGTLEMVLAMIGIEDQAAQRALQAEQTDIILSNQPLSAPLRHSRITLFKAMQFATPGEYQSANGQALLALEDNGLAVLNARLRRVPLAANHYSIIYCHQEIGEALMG